MRPIILAAAIFILPLAAQAFELDLVNKSRLTVAGISLYPLDAAGEPIEDNLGGSLDALAPGAERRLSITSGCGPMLAVVMLENGGELRLNFDSCSDRTIIVRD